MSRTDTLRIVIIGSGGVASSLAPALDALPDVEVVQVYSPTLAHAENLASRLSGAVGVDDYADISTDAGMYLVSVRDDAIAPLAATLVPRTDAVWVHTSGSVPMSALAPLGGHTGVFYPLQTFSRERIVDVAEVPFFIEGSDDATAEFLRNLARRLSPHVFYADGDTRRLMHVAAVFACNFTNHLWAIAADLLGERGIPFDVMRPLLEETLRKALAAHPEKGQTGPARRGDVKVMDAHRKMLRGSVADLYTSLSQSIMNRNDTL